MLSRDFVGAFLIGQVASGLTESEAKANFSNWLLGQNESIVTETEKDQILADLNSYSVKQ